MQQGSRAELRLDRIAAPVGAVVVAAIVVWLAGAALRPRTSVLLDLVWVLLTSLPWALGWLLAAAGLGWPLRRWLARDARDGALVQVGLGVAAMLVLDAALGTVGILQWAGAGGAWALLLLGIGLLVVQLRVAPAPRAAPPWLCWAAAPAVAVLLIAACSAPGWLWASEFGGYDALSYHLQLPKEWLSLGRIAPLEHNVYSFLPGYVEAAYYHLAVLIGDGIAAVYACQLLHASFSVFAAAATGRLAGRCGGRLAGAVAAALMLGTPWVVVAGSLAYSEMTAAFLLATALLLIDDDAAAPRRAAALGLLAAAAVGAKLTAAGLVALPLAVLLAGSSAPRRWPAAGAAAGALGLVALLPWLVRNGVACGNPLFPFATDVLGTAHWTAEQARIWSEGHVADAGLADRLIALCNEFLRYGLGPNPDPAEPWAPQWSLLPWLAAAGVAAGALRRDRRRISLRLGIVLLIQVGFWLALTHLKSRFLLPAVVPAAAAAGVGLTRVAPRRGGATGRGGGTVAAAAAIAALLWCSLPLWIYRAERRGMAAEMVGRAGVLSGDDLAPPLRAEHARDLPAVYLNYVLPAGSRTLLVGEAAVFYYRADVVYRTTWDRGPLSELMRLHPDDPAVWMDRLRRQGFTHLLVNPEMLARWAEAGWNDPLMTPQRVLGAAGRFAEPVAELAAGLRLYRLPSSPEPKNSSSSRSRSSSSATAAIVSASAAGRRSTEAEASRARRLSSAWR